MLRGDGGTGKSTIVRKIAHDWASPETVKSYFVHRFKTVLFVEGRKLGERGMQACLDDMIEIKSEKNHNWLVENSNQILLIVDGVDEIGEAKEGSISGWEDLVKILKKEKYPGMNVILTTRPSQASSLEQYCDRIVDNLGFNREQSKRYIHAYFHEDVSLAQS